MNASEISSREQVLTALRQRVGRLAGKERRQGIQGVTTGCDAFDQLFPPGGIPRGSLMEWLSADCGGGAGTLALVVAREAAREGGIVVVVDGERRFYPPAAAALGIELQRLLVVLPPQPQEITWCLDQALRCPGVAAVWAPLTRLDQRTFRRLQLAAESGGTLGLLLRPARIRGRPTWASWQLLVEPRPSANSWRLRVERLRGTGTLPRSQVELTLEETSGTLREWPAVGDEKPADSPRRNWG